MTVLLVGADQLGNIPKELKQQGCKEIIHWSGRKKNCSKKNIPSRVNMVVIFHDYVSHVLMNTIKDHARNLSLPVIFSKRSVADINKNFREKLFS